MTPPSYLIIIKSLMPNVVASLYHDLSENDPPQWTEYPHIWLTILMLILTPLSFLRKLDQLRHTSYVALFSVGRSHHLRVSRCPELTVLLCSLFGVNCHRLFHMATKRYAAPRRGCINPLQA